MSVKLPDCCLNILKNLVEKGEVGIDKGNFDEILLFSFNYGISPIIIIKDNKDNRIQAYSLFFYNEDDNPLNINFPIINKNIIKDIITYYIGNLPDFSETLKNLKLSEQEINFIKKIKELVEYLRSSNNETKLIEYPFYPLVQHGLKKWSGNILESKHPINLNYIVIRDFLFSNDGGVNDEDIIEYYFFNGFSGDKYGEYGKIMPLLVIKRNGPEFEKDKLINSIISVYNQTYNFINILKYGNLKVSFELIPVSGFNSTQLQNIIKGIRNILEVYIFKIKAEIYWLPKSTITGTIALKHFLHGEDSHHILTYRGLTGINRNKNIILNNIQEVIDKTNYSSNQNYLLVAPHGSGKESYANLIILTNKHRYRGRFITISAVGKAENLLSQLFGERINSAVRSGLVEKAKNGALFIDEIGKSEPEFRSALLRFLQTGDYMRKNGIEKLRRDHLLMIFASTDEDLERSPDPPDFWDRLTRINIENPFKELYNKENFIIRKLNNKFKTFIKHFFLSVMWDYFENEIDPKNPITIEIFRDKIIGFCENIFDGFWKKFTGNIKECSHEKLWEKCLKEKLTFRYFVKFARDYSAEIYKNELTP